MGNRWLRIFLLSGMVIMQLGYLAAEEIKPKDKINQIYQLDEEVRLKEKERLATLEAAEQAKQVNKFELAHELKQKAARLEEELNDLKNGLEKLLKEYENEWLAQSWWHRLAFETSLLYTHFDNSLDIDDAYGLKFKMHWVKREFQQFHPGSYLYYPRERGESYPLRRIEVSSFMIEYRKTHSQTVVRGKNEDVEINSYLVGFGFLGQSWGNTYIKLNLAGGLQRYTGTEPNDTGPLVGYTLGAYQKILEKCMLGLEITEEAVFTRANQDVTDTSFNFSAAFVLRFSF